MLHLVSSLRLLVLRYPPPPLPSHSRHHYIAHHQKCFVILTAIRPYPDIATEYIFVLRTSLSSSNRALLPLSVHNSLGGFTLALTEIALELCNSTCTPILPPTQHPMVVHPSTKSLSVYYHER